ncbi:MAG: hypothetical protein MN733_30255 [Nitrososphaera sp.]|nr:hypothetical protein [Nitrososphaera sp.]
MDDEAKRAKLLELLGSAELPDSATIPDTVIAESFPNMDNEQRKMITKILKAKLPTPQEIEQAERLAQHNAEARKIRQEKLAKRKERRALRESKKRK